MRSSLGIAHLKLIVDQPFIFFIYNTRPDIPVFMGKIVNPSGCDGKLVYSTAFQGNDETVVNNETSQSKRTEKMSGRVRNNKKQFNSLFTDKYGYGIEICPSGDLEACAGSCRGNTRAHNICIESCEKKCSY